MDKFVQAIVFATTVGSVYALVVLGYSLIFSTTRIVNFAEGTLVVVGGYLAWWGYSKAFDAHLHLALVTFLVVIASAGVGLVVYLIAVVPLGRFDPATNIGWLVTTFGAGIVLQELVAKRISNTGQSLPASADSVFGWRGSVVSNVAIRPSDLILIIATLVVFVALESVENHTRVGRALRAVAQDRQTASVTGINPSAIVMLSFAIAGVLAALGGVLIAPKFGTVRFNIALDLGVFGFVAAVIGGLGSTRGAVVGGYLIGLVGGIVGVVSDRGADTYRPLVVFIVFALILVLRPAGLFAKPVVEKV